MEKYIKEYNEWLIEQDFHKMSNGFLCGRMGLCVYWFQQSRIYKNPKYEDFANSILNNVLEKIGVFSGVSFEDGITGIALAIDHLIKERYIKGNTTSFFESIDDKLFQYAYFRNIDPIKKESFNANNLLWICLYFCQRIQSKELSNENEIIIKRLLIECVNLLENRIRDDYTLLREPTGFSPFSYFLPNFILFLSKLYEIELYTYKIDVLCNELYRKICHCIPINFGNRYLLLFSINKLLGQKTTFPSELYEYGRILHEFVSKKEILNQFRSNDLNIRNGISGLLLYIYNDIEFKENIDLLRNRIETCIKDKNNSTLWKNKKNFNLGDSITGFFYTYQRIKMKIQ